MKPNRRPPARKRERSKSAAIEDVSGENWDSEVIGLLLRDGESSGSVIRPEPSPTAPLPRKENDLSRANLTGADLSEAHLNGAELVLAQLSHAELRKARLAGARLSHANLNGADLKGVDLNGADLSFADLTQTDLRDANLLRANLENADLRAADLRAARMSTARLAHAKLAGALFDESTTLPFERSEALELGLLYTGTDAEPDVEVVSGGEGVE